MNISLHDNIRKYILNLDLYTILAKCMCRTLREELAKRSIDVFSITWRRKSLPSVIDKIDRKTYESIDELSDLAGIRIICSSVNQIQPVLETALDLFLIPEIEDTTKREGISAFGYSSLHCLAKWNPETKGPILLENLHEFLKRMTNDVSISEETKINMQPQIDIKNKDSHKLQIEIQIRTILQHAWAGISHQFLYKNESEVSDSVKRRLARLAAILEEADEAFGEEIKSISEIENNKIKQVSPSSDSHLSYEYLMKYADEVLEEKMTDAGAKSTLNVASNIGIKTISQFEKLLASTIEALVETFAYAPLLHLRCFYAYVSTVGVWAGKIDSPFTPMQQDMINECRDLVHEELFQKTLKEINDK